MPSITFVLTFRPPLVDKHFLTSYFINNPGLSLSSQQWLAVKSLVAIALLVLLYRLIQIYLKQEQYCISSETLTTESQEVHKVNASMLRDDRGDARGLQRSVKRESLLSKKRRDIRKRQIDACSIRRQEALHGPISISIQNWTAPAAAPGPSHSQSDLQSGRIERSEALIPETRCTRIERETSGARSSEEMSSSGKIVNASTVERGYVRVANNQRVADTQSLFHDLIVANQEVRNSTQA